MISTTKPPSNQAPQLSRLFGIITPPTPSTTTTAAVITKIRSTLVGVYREMTGPSSRPNGPATNAYPNKDTSGLLLALKMSVPQTLTKKTPSANPTNHQPFWNGHVHL